MEKSKIETRDVRDIGMPGISGDLSSMKLEKYKIKYKKVDVDDPVAMLELSDIETKALHAKHGDEEIVLVSTDKFTFMEKYFVILKYMEKI